MLLTLLAIESCSILFPSFGIILRWTSSFFPLKGPEILLGFSKTCENDCEAIQNRFTDGLVTQFLLEWSPNALIHLPSELHRNQELVLISVGVQREASN